MNSICKFIYITLLMILTASCKEDIPTVTMHTEAGNILVEVYTDKAPVTASNFLDLCKNSAYRNSMFYRVVNQDNQEGNKVKIDVIQGGLYLDSIIDAYPAIAHETTKTTGLKHLDGSISMARNEPGTASTEFFICVGPQPELDFGGKRNPDGQGFAVFGRVIQGMDVVREIHRLKADSQYLDRPIMISNIILNEK